MLASDKHSSSSDPFVSYEENEVLRTLLQHLPIKAIIVILVSIGLIFSIFSRSNNNPFFYFGFVSLMFSSSWQSTNMLPDIDRKAINTSIASYLHTYSRYISFPVSVPAIYIVSLSPSLSLSHTHTHTHTYTQLSPCRCQLLKTQLFISKRVCLCPFVVPII